MKIGIAQEFNNFYKSDEIFSRLKKIGYDGVDYSLSSTYCCPDPLFSRPRSEWVKHFEEVAATLKLNGMEALQTHATFSTNFDGETRLSQRCLDQYKREIEATAILGSPYIVIHPINIALYGRDKQLDYDVNMEAFALLEPILKQHNVKLGVENMFGWDDVRRRNCPTGCSLPEDMVKYIDGTHSDSFVACLDTGHMLINCVSPADAVKILGKRLKLLHVHDNYGITDNHNAPTQGIADWKAFAAALKEVGYDGAFSMEVSFARVMKTDKELCWDYAEFAYKAAKRILEV